MTNSAVTAWYDAKTDWLLSKYGPGPRIHFHTGLAPMGVQAAPDEAGLRRQIVAAQEALLVLAASLWETGGARFIGELVDVGCGLGGSALFFASRPENVVTAVSPVERHLRLIGELAQRGGVASRVRTELSDAHELPGTGRFDHGYAIDATTYFDRRSWFRTMHRLLRPGGRLGISDTFVVDGTLAHRFNDYWLADVGTHESYVAAAREAGFRLVAEQDVSDASGAFYDLSVAHSRALLEQGGIDDAALARRHRSIAWQSEFADAFRARRFRGLILAFERA